MADEPVTKGDLTAAIQELKEYIDERTHDAETRLLRAFADYQTASNIRLRKLESEGRVLNRTTSDRLSELERRVSEIDIRVLNLESKSERT